MNAVEIEEAVTELTQQPYEPVTFITGFMAAYGASATTITRLKGGDGNTSDLAGGILWKKWLHFQPAAEGQASNVLDAIEASRKTAQGKVRYAITTDGAEFAARDLKTGEALFCPLPDLENHFGFFLPIAGIDRYEVADENPVDIKATGRLAKLYDALIAENPDWATDARVTYTYFEQLNGYEHLKSLGIGYHFYKGVYLDSIAEVLDTNKKTIIHIPHTAAAESTKDKYSEVGHILDAIGDYKGVDPATGFYLVQSGDGGSAA